MESKPSNPTWLSLLNVLAGFFLVILSFFVLINLELAKILIVYLLALSLSMICIARILNGFFDKYLSKQLRTVNILLAVLGLIIAVIALMVANTDLLTAILLLAIGLTIQGVLRIAIGGLDRTFSNWIRGILIITGIVTVILSGLVILFPQTSEEVLFAVLAIVLLINGLARISKGAAGLEIFDESLPFLIRQKP